jgi:very-short-patch-repair endonuclease
MLTPALRTLSSRQHGVLLRTQLAEARLTRDQVRQLVRSDQLVRVTSAVFRTRGTPDSLAHRRSLALLDAGPGSALSHLTAARMWSLYRRSEGRIDVVRTRDGLHRRTPHLATVHTSRRLPEDHVVHLGGLAVTTPARTVVDLATTEPLGRVARMLDNALGHRLLHIHDLTEALAVVRAKGRRGVATLDLLIAERLDLRPMESALERRMEELFHRAGETSFRRQVDLGDDDGWICRADFFSDRRAAVVFVDGHVWHSSLLDRARDDSQTRRLRAAGYNVERFSDLEILYETAAVLRRINRLRTAA